MEKFTQHSIIFRATTLLIVLIQSQKLSAFPTDIAVGYGSHCNETALCDLNKSLSCTAGFCLCINTETMVYDNETRSCLVLAGNPCVIENQVSLSLTNKASSIEAPNQRELSCVKNADCDHSENACTCNDHFKELKNGSCVAKNLYNESCNALIDCREDLDLECVENKCVCNSGKAIYDKIHNPGQCAGLAGKLCVQDRCTKHASCVTYTHDEERPSNTTVGLPFGKVKKICDCVGDYAPTPLGLCAKDFGIRCSEIYPCKEWLGLRCGEENTCECMHPEFQVFDKFTGKCRYKVGSPCNLPLTGAPTNWTSSFTDSCIFGAECVTNNQATSATDINLKNKASFSCVCRKGFVENQNGGCDLGHGRKCKYSRQTCSSEANLECKGNTCKCKLPFYEYDKTTKTCVGRAGTHCRNVLAINTSNHESNQPIIKMGIKSIGCVRGAKCEVEEGPGTEYFTNKENVTIMGICKCVWDKLEDGSCREMDVAKAEYIITAGGILLVMAIVGTFCYAVFKRQILDVLNLK